MRKFTCLTDEKAPETKWFPSTCGASGRQIGHSLVAAETTSIWLCQMYQPYKYTLFSLFLAYSCGFKRHNDPLYGSVT